jgi:hypothetical protein
MKCLGWEKMDGGKLWRYREGLPTQTIEWAWKFHDPNFGFSKEIGGYGDHDTVYVALGFVALYFSRDSEEREAKACRRGFNLCWNYWQRWFGDPDQDGERVFYLWREGLLDAVFGRTVYACSKGRKYDFTISMPEGAYAAKFTEETRIWTRERWPLRKVRKSIGIDIPKGIPFAGKGENSWDMGDDGLFGTGSDGWDPWKAAESVKAIVLRHRKKYGEPSKYGQGIARDGTS